MSDRYTAISLRGVWDSGLAVHGRESVPEMISQLRNRAVSMRATADAILSASAADFLVESYVGAHVRNKRVVLQEGKKP